jgi:hypothetical protein
MRIGFGLPVSGSWATPATVVRIAVEAEAGTQGVTDVFYDLNWDSSIAAVNLDPVRSADRALEIMERLSPSGTA